MKRRALLAGMLGLTVALGSLASMPVAGQVRGQKPYSPPRTARWSSRPARHLRPGHADAAGAARQREGDAHGGRGRRARKGRRRARRGRVAAKPGRSPRAAQGRRRQSGRGRQRGRLQLVLARSGLVLHDRQRRATHLAHHRSTRREGARDDARGAPAFRRGSGPADVRRDAERRSGPRDRPRRLRRPRAPSARRALPARDSARRPGRRRCRTTSTTTSTRSCRRRTP